MYRIFFFVAVIGLIFISIFGYLFYSESKNVKKIDSFKACEENGFPIMESYPRQCMTPDGRNFVEDISNNNHENNGSDIGNFIHVTYPVPGDKIRSPLVVKGEARGTWFFEASFPVRLVLDNGIELVAAPAQAKGEWMTEDFVPFEATLNFTNPTSQKGTLILMKDNPSGLPQFEKSISIPVVLENVVTTVKPCFATGCSGQVCASEDVTTTCELREEYMCYKTATCERQPNGKCGWTPTSALTQCLNANQ